MRFSVVIPTYNRKGALRQCVRALLVQDYDDYEIIVVDDGSTDGTGQMVATEFPTVRCFSQANRGPAAARNVGIRMANGDIIAFTDDDCVAPPTWLSQLVDGYVRHPEVAGVGGYLDPPDRLLRANSIAQYDYYVSHTLYEQGDREYLGGFECPAGGTNSMSYRRSVLDQVGGFDESFIYAGEDPELKLRVCQLGYQLLYVPSRLIHLRDFSWHSFRKQQIARGRGVVHFERKHGPMPTTWRLLLRFGKRGFLFLSDLFTIRPGLAWVKLWAGWYDCWGQWTEIQEGGKRNHAR